MTDVERLLSSSEVLEDTWITPPPSPRPFDLSSSEQWSEGRAWRGHSGWGRQAAHCCPSHAHAAHHAFPTDVNGRKRVVILGSGDFGLALLKRLCGANYDVVVGSRHPQRTRERVAAAGGRVMLQGEAAQCSTVVVVAVPFQHIQSLPLHLLANKILIDASNRTQMERRGQQRSQAERVQELVPSAAVVKALNVLSAYTLSRGIRGSKEVPVCGDNEAARALVSTMVRDLGFDPIDRGSLVNARQVEMIPFTFFTQWRPAFVISLIFWVIFFFITIFEWQLCNNLRGLSQPGGTFNWSRFDQVTLRNVSRACACDSLVLFALCYLAGVVAAVVQLWRGTRYSAFPAWLDGWLLARKYLGIFMLFTATVHVFYEVSGLDHYDQPDPSWAWRASTFMGCGVWSYAFAIVLGLVSLPSVSACLSWREFSFLQSRVGWVAFLLAVLHVVFLEWHNLVFAPLTCYLPSVGQWVMIVPIATVALKLPLLLPCVDRALTNIRQGNNRTPEPPVIFSV